MHEQHAYLADQASWHNISEASTHSRVHPPKLKAEGATSDSMNSISGHLSDTLSLAGTVSRTPQ